MKAFMTLEMNGEREQCHFSIWILKLVDFGRLSLLLLFFQ